jgi:hypothetical protein
VVDGGFGPSVGVGRRPMHPHRIRRIRAATRTGRTRKSAAVEVRATPTTRSGPPATLTRPRDPPNTTPLPRFSRTYLPPLPLSPFPLTSHLLAVGRVRFTPRRLDWTPLVMAGVSGRGAAERVAAAVEAVGSGGWEFRNAYRRQLLALSRRIRLLGPFVEELREVPCVPAVEPERALAVLADALEEALDLLQLGRDGSRIFLVRAYLLLSPSLVPHLCWIPDAWLPVRPFSIIFKIKNCALKLHSLCIKCADI